uniref:TonB-dependent receptor n=1 Tax=Eiseniibacteriota bacterium TaxID=2212470 RepID=A0A832I5M8_UNCEI
MFADSLAAAAAAAPPGGGWGVALATGDAATSFAPAGARTRSVFVARSGDPQIDETALAVERRGARGGARIELLSGTRAGAGAFGRAGRHRWGLDAWGRRGAHRLETGFVQAGAATSLASGEGQDASAGAGFARWRWSDRSAWAAAGIERAYSAHESFAAFFAASRRDAEDERAWAAGGRGLGGGSVAARLEVSRARVRRDADPAFDRTARGVWGGVRVARTVGDGTLELDAGGGRHGRLGGAFAPALRYRVAHGAVAACAAVERLVSPVWSDLAPGTVPFLQDTWALRMESAWSRPGAHAALGGLVGRTADRALVARLPIEDLWLRLGAARDAGRWDFALLSGSASWSGRALGAGAEGFALARDRRAAQARVDPAAGLRAWGEWRGTFFAGDLGVRLRLEGAGVGERESEAAAPRRLAPYLTWGATLALTLADATVFVRARNLEDRIREQAWVDLATGREALGAGRTVETVLVWRLFD